MPLKNKIKVSVGIPNLSNNDRYGGYRSYVLDSIREQETSIEIMPPYITPPHAGNFAHGKTNRLDAIVGRMNNIIDKYVTTDASRVLIIDGDVEVPPNAVDTLIRHNVDIASGVYPYHDFTTRNAMLFGRIRDNHPCGLFENMDWKDMKGKVFGDGEKWSGGSGCLLMKKRLFKRHHPKIPALRFTRDNNGMECGADMLFWKRVQGAGFTARVDARVVCSHLPNYRLSNKEEWLT